METELIEQIKLKLIPLEIEYYKAKTKYNKGFLKEKQLDRAADIEGWIAELNRLLDILEQNKKLGYQNEELLKIVLSKK